MIGFCSPFSWQESTCATIQLAELARSLGHQVSVFTQLAHMHQIWPAGGDSLVSDKRCPFEWWSKRVNHIVWFDHQPQLLASAVARNIRNTLVVVRDRLPPDPFDILLAYDNVVCPNPSCYEYVSRSIGIPQSHEIDWVPGPQLQHAPPRNTRRWIVPIDRGVLHHIGPAVMYWLQTLVQSFPEIELTLLQTKAWNRDTARGLASLGNSARNLRVLRNPTYDIYMDVVATHQMSLSLNPSNSLGMFALMSLQVGTPVMAWDAPPYSLFQNSGCHLLSCDHVKATNGAAMAVPDFASMMSGVARALDDTTQQCDDTSWDAAYCQFVASWKEIWS